MSCHHRPRPLRSPIPASLAALLVAGLAGCSGGGSSSSSSGGGEKPVADAGSQRVVGLGEEAVVDGSASRDPERRTLAFRWTLAERPPGSGAALLDAASARARLTPDVLGAYRLRLVVSAGGRDSEPSDVFVHGDSPADLRVGPGRPLAVPSAAAALAKDGDVIAIDAGTYRGDVAVWRQNGLVLRGAGGVAQLEAGGAYAQGKGTWVVQGNDTTVERLAFTGAKVPDKNGAGIRQEGAGLTLRHCAFTDNENGVMTSSNDQSDIVIEHCELARNGHGDGRSHNLYVNRVRSLTLRHCYVHRAKIGHNVKSRARTTRVLYCRIMDEVDGRASYQVEMPDGGVGVLVGNLIQQGPDAANSTLVSFGAEGLVWPQNELHVVNNTLVNDRQGGTFVMVWGGSATLRNNVFTGSGSVLAGSGGLFTNLVLPDPGLVDRASYDYRLTSLSPAIDQGSAPGEVGGFDLTPRSHYVHAMQGEARPVVGKLDIGAFEFR